MLIIPYSSDAPLYHFPKATLGVIATNVAIHIVREFLPPDAAEPLAMKLGAGLQPLQWLTHNFLHADYLHLIFNMVFLWSYGIIVEGKIGWLLFLLSYLGIGTVHGAVIQVAYLGAEEPSYVLGASAIIFGLMAICMVWAPFNELSCFYLFIVVLRIFTGTFEIPIYGFALLQLFLEGLGVLLAFLIHSDPMSSAFLHVSGAFWGLVVGILFVKAGWVDCEGWDVFSLARKRRALRQAWKEREARLDRANRRDRKPPVAVFPTQDQPSVPFEERVAQFLARLHRSIKHGDTTAMQTAFDKWTEALGKRPPRDALLEVIRAMHEREQWVASVPAMRLLCKLYPERSEKARLKLASILIRILERPTEAQRHLAKIADENLDAPMRKIRRKLHEEATHMINDGVLEVEEDV